MRIIFAIAIAAAAALSFGCGGGAANNSASAAANSQTPEKQNVVAMGRPQSIIDKMTARGDQDMAQPVLKIVEPKDGAELPSSTVSLKLDLSGDLKGYKPSMDPETHTGNHIHVILDNQPYEAYYNIDQPFELKNVSDGPHTIRVFPSRPWHESYKNAGAFQMVKFTVKNGGGDSKQPTTTSDGNTMANANTGPTPEAKEMKASNAGDVDPTKPLLTYSRPKGEYKGEDAKYILLDFWLSNTDMTAEGTPRVGSEPCPCRVRYAIDGVDMGYINRWGPIWLNGWIVGKHTVKLELLGHDGKVVDNGGYNSTEREITVSN